MQRTQENYGWSETVTLLIIEISYWEWPEKTKIEWKSEETTVLGKLGEGQYQLNVLIRRLTIKKKENGHLAARS